MAVLTPDSFDCLLRWLDPQGKQGGEQYERIRSRLLRFFECRGCPTPEEATDETIDRVARRIAGGETVRADPTLYFHGVARNVLMESWRGPARRTVALTELAERELPAPPSGPEAEPEDARLECLTRCLETLPNSQREMVVEYYEWGRRERIHSRKELAARLGLPLNALRLRVHRIREALERCVNVCLQRGAAGDIHSPAAATSWKREADR
jgi:DNA-directed RNA polymerase specialized sigma24 family protein